MLLQSARAAVARAARRLGPDRLVTGTAGNVSLRDPASGLIAITPSGLPYEELTAEDIVVVDGAGAVVAGRHAPSSELPLHCAIYRARAADHAVVHTHSPFATAFAACGREIPAVHYEIAFATRGAAIRVAPYATYGTEELARNAVATLGADSAVLLQNHGVVAVGPTLERAYTVALKVEYLAELAYHALQIGSPILLGEEELARVRARFERYGQPRRPE